MSNTTAIPCEGDTARQGCGQQIAMIDRGAVVRAGGGQRETSRAYKRRRKAR